MDPGPFGCPFHSHDSERTYAQINLAGRARTLADSAGLLAVGVLRGSYLGTTATAAVPNRAPICNNSYFTVPSTVDAKARIPVLNLAADPDVTELRDTGRMSDVDVVEKSVPAMAFLS